MEIPFIDLKDELIVALVALIISIIALVYTVLTFLLKKGHKFRCTISTCSSRECSDPYVSSFTLQNLKDKASVIFSIHLKLGRGNYLLLEDFAEKPLILHAFEVYYKEYQPLVFYEAGLKQINIDKLLHNQKVKKRVILSTTSGKYEVKIGMKHWKPEYLFFKNYATAIVKPHYLTHDGLYYGDSIKYLVELMKTGKKTVIALQAGDEDLQRFAPLKLTAEVLSNKEVLEQHLKSLIDKKSLEYDDFTVIDFEEKIQARKKNYENEVHELKPHSFFYYNVLGRIGTILENKRLRKQNKRSTPK